MSDGECGECNECESTFELIDVDPNEMICPECESRDWVNNG